MVVYIILGIIWLMVMEKFITQSEENLIQAYLIRVGSFLLWPIVLCMFIFYFIKEFQLK
jgi:hypothetical protein